MSDKYEIKEDKADHHFRTEIPHIIHELLKEKKISPLTFVLYSVLKKTAGDYGSCFKTNETLAEECGFSKTTLKKCLKELEKVRLPNNLKIIEVFRRTNPDGSPDTNLIKIIDIWRHNGDTMRERFESKKDSKDNRGGSPKNLPLGRQKTEGGSPKNPKEDPLKKNPPPPHTPQEKERLICPNGQMEKGGGGLKDQEEIQKILDILPSLEFKLSAAKVLRLCQTYSPSTVGHAIYNLTKRSLAGVRSVDSLLAKDCQELDNYLQFKTQPRCKK